MTVDTADDARRTDLEAQAEQLTQGITAEKARLDTLIPDFETRFKSEQATREAEWEAVSEKLTTDADKLSSESRATVEKTVETLKEAAQATAAGLEEKASAIVGELEEKRDEVQNLYRVIADTGTAGAFAKDAQTQKTEADKWRNRTLILGIATVALAVGAVVFAALADDTSTQAHVGALLVAVFAGGLTAYAAKQSGLHRDREESSKRLEMELVAFGPFTDALESPDDARKAYAERLFRGSERAIDEKSLGKDQVTLLQTIVETLIKPRS